jgi:hypothetical protein
MRRALPVIAGLVVIATLILLAAVRRPARAPVEASAVPAAAPVASGASSAVAPADSTAAAAPQTPLPPGRAADSVPTQGGPPPVGPKKPPLTPAEKRALAGHHIDTMQLRIRLLDGQAADDAAAGRAEEAEQKRVIARRLRAHIDRLQADIAAGREPDSEE